MSKLDNKKKNNIEADDFSEYNNKDSIYIRQVARIDDHVLVASFSEDKRPQGFEVHKLIYEKPRDKVINGKHIHFNERLRLARSREFGLYAWWYPSLDYVMMEYPQFKEHAKEIESSIATFGDVAKAHDDASFNDIVEPLTSLCAASASPEVE